MADVVIWHNPRCSKSRQTLALLEEKGHKVEVRKYLEEPPTAEEISDALDKLGIGPRELLRRGEEAYKAKGLKDPKLSDKALIQAMVEEPKLIERPIVFAGGAAALGRPPEQVLDLF
ncbi:MAG: arsenate reductase (glutaredoxin) [Myxococcales bacterium]|nr:arsenate reductase (glutaredoxin) [Myxococcales bacterium]